MNGDFSLLSSFCDSASSFVTSSLSSCQMILCLPYTLLYFAKISLSNNFLCFGAQDCSQFDNGSFTGQISCRMLFEVGCSYVICGHSERRVNNFETSIQVRKKAQKIIEYGMVPIICVGESKKSLFVEQLNLQSASFPRVGNYIVAYEPAWAIGTDLIPTNNEIKNSLEIIRSHTDMPVVYGGSVDINNSVNIVSNNNLNGVLVGRNSLDFSNFLAIANSLKFAYKN